MADDIELQLKRLVLDEDFTDIQSLVQEEVNLMSILGIQHKELQHSNFLAWLFNPRETHGFGDYPLKEFIKTYFVNHDYEDLGDISVFDYTALDLSDIEIRREYRNIDLILTSPSNKLCIVIENKIYSGEREGQLKKYHEIVQTEYPDFKQVFMFLSLEPQDISSEMQRVYVSVTYEYVLQLIQKLLKTKSMDDKVQFVLQQYETTLQSLLNMNEEIEKTAQKLYKSHKGAFDLIFKYVQPSNKVPNNLLELIEKEPSLHPFRSSAAYISFQPQWLYDALPTLRNKGIFSAEEELAKSTLFLFEFYVGEDRIQFDFKIGEHNDPTIRELLYRVYTENKDVFNAISFNSKLYPKYHIAFQKHIVKKQEVKKYNEEGEEEIYKLAQQRFRELVDKDLPRIQEVIQREILS
ncbi:hypothetical protein COU78_05015 [Candidatus Peregrinibacteria bacterium CG10_big_fil_rev_8_21_14_0_10_49_24]|nr:MAG: hypothetical protein COU78_05015 [Candidatus Peregrinibacteria bacterium CG10_big_fil_rev_8_21_14_0_10_49_24]